jgi:hypothetical protein
MPDNGEESYETPEEEVKDWLSELKDDGPTLVFGSEFTPRCSLQSVNLKRETFERALVSFVVRFHPARTVFPPEFIDRLYQHALFDHRQMAAWDEAKRMTQSREFKTSVEHLENEIKHHSQLLKLMNSGRQKWPTWMTEWSEAWVGASLDLQKRIVKQLSSALGDARVFTRIAALGRTSVESHLVSIAKDPIREALVSTSTRVPLKTMIAGYAHASQLIRMGANEESDFVTAINMRISRARHSRERVQVLSFLFTHLS